MITLLILLVMAFTQTMQENSNEVNEVMSKYIKNLHDIEAKYVMQPVLARMVTRLLNGTMNIFPLMKLSMSIDRTPVRIPWEIGEPMAKPGETQYKLIKPRNKRKKRRRKTTTELPTPRPRAEDDDVKPPRKEKETTTAKVAEDEKKGSTDLPGPHVNEDHLTQSHEEREAAKATTADVETDKGTAPPTPQPDNLKQSHEGKEGIETKVTVVDKERITTIANDEKEKVTSDPTSSHVDTHKPSRRNRRRPVSDEE